MKKILKDILAEVKPRGIPVDIKEFLDELNKRLKKNKLKAKAVTGGSIAKGTFLKGDHDVDIFVKFKYPYREQNISKLLKKALAGLKAKEVKGSRNYFHIGEFEIVPVLDIKNPDKALNVTDMSPLHMSWVKKHSNAKLRDDIRVAKQFCKGQEVYGAESHIKGFSGHVLDLLIIHYKGFKNLLKQCQTWKHQEVIDFHDYHKGDALAILNKSKISPLIVIDPVQPNRNAAAALSKEKITIFKKAAKDFLTKPSIEFFRVREIDIKELKKTNQNLIILRVKPLTGKKDVVGSKLLKAFKHVNNNLKKHDFKVLEDGWNFKLFYFIIKNEKMSDFIIRDGPPTKLKAACEKFKAKHKKTYTKNKRLYTKLKRTHKKPEGLVKELVKDNYIKQRVKSIKL